VKVKSAKLLGSFVAYCMQNPELTFWQALRNWAEYKYIIASDECPVFNNQFNTYNWSERNNK